MNYMSLINCFVNGASHEYYAKHAAPLVDEDLSMTFDAADKYATAIDTSSADDETIMTDAHRAGRAYTASI